MDERVKFIAAYLKGEIGLARLAESFGVSRRTGYKWIDRYTQGGGGSPRQSATDSA